MLNRWKISITTSMFTTSVRDASCESPLLSAHAKRPSAAAAKSSETNATRHASSPLSSGSPGARGGRDMVPGSVGSKASVIPSVTAVTMLIQRIWTGVIGSTRPSRIAATIARDSPALVGSVQAMTLVRLS